MEHLALEPFIELVDLDALMVRFGKELVELDKSSQGIQKQIQSIQEEVKNGQNGINQLRKHVHSLDLELKTIDTQEKEKKRKLEGAASPKEYFSLEGELQALQKKRIGFEEAYLTVWQQLEEAEAQLEAIRAQAPQKIQALEKELSEIQKRKEYLEQRIEHGKKERNAYTTKVTPELLQEYQTMLERVPNPVVPILKDSCSACFYIVSHHRLQESKALSKLIKCQDCFRLLYFPRTAEKL